MNTTASVNQGLVSFHKSQSKSKFHTNYSHLPDGPRKRKAKKAKHDLIRGAKIKKEYAKTKQREHEQTQPASMDLHPERQAALNKRASDRHGDPEEVKLRKRSVHKIAPFENERLIAQERREEREERRRHFEEAAEQRAFRSAEREKFQKALQKARKPDHKGQRRLGRESKLLPNMVEGLLRRLEREKSQPGGNAG